MAASQITQSTKIPFGTDGALLDRALEAGGVGFWDYQPSTGLIDLFHNVSAFQSLRPGRYRGPATDFAKYIFPDDCDAVTQVLAHCANNVAEIAAEFRIRTDSGAVVWLACRGRLTTLENEAPCYAGTIADITHVPEREQRLLAYHESLFSLARNSLVVDSADFCGAAAHIVIQGANTLRTTRGGLWKLSEDRQALECTFLHDSRTTATTIHSGNRGAKERTDQISEAVGMRLDVAAFPTYFSAISQRRSLAVENALTSPELHEFRDSYFPATGVCALLDVPILLHGQLWGLLCFEDCAGVRTWDSNAQAYAGSVADLLSLALEASERAKAEIALASTHDRHRAFIQTSRDSIWSADIAPGIDTTLPAQQQIAQLREQAHITDANDAFIRDYGLEAAHVVGRRVAEFMPELFKGSSLHDWIARDYRLIDRELRLKGKQTEQRWLSLTLLGVVEGGKLVRIWGARREISDRKRYQRLLEHLAFRDPLTGLLNRQRLVSAINDMIESAQSQETGEVATLFLLDLNQFKDINDTLGHGAGDEVLRQMKSRFDDALALDNAVVARLGGDEFGVFVRGIGTAEGALRICNAITTSLAQPFVIGGGKFHVSASIGAAIYPTHGQTFSALSHAADEAMYHAKQTGGGVRLFSRSTTVFEHRKLLLLAGLPAAIERGELALEFQPIIDCQTRKPARMEALVRWNHPEYGRLTANDFIHKAEMSDSIHVLTRWVIETALRTARDWQSIAPGVGVSVNISPRLLGDTNVVAHLKQSSQRFDLPARLVDLEITETALIHNPERAAQILADCKAQGFSIVIDDYGVGFCSLAYLRRLPLKGIKLDQSFVTKVMQSAEDAIIVQSTITLAHNLGLTIVAEGVEDVETLKFLELHGCDYAQGYGISYPMSVTDTLLWLQEKNSALPRAATLLASK